MSKSSCNRNNDREAPSPLLLPLLALLTPLPSGLGWLKVLLVILSLWACFCRLKAEKIPEVTSAASSRGTSSNNRNVIYHINENSLDMSNVAIGRSCGCTSSGVCDPVHHRLRLMIQQKKAQDSAEDCAKAAAEVALVWSVRRSMKAVAAEAAHRAVEIAEAAVKAQAVIDEQAQAVTAEQAALFHAQAAIYAQAILDEQATQFAPQVASTVSPPQTPRISREVQMLQQSQLNGGYWTQPASGRRTRRQR